VREPDYLQRTRTGYDLTAAKYADLFHDHLREKPVDQAMLAAFAGLVIRNGGGLVVDVGCGTGATTAILRELGIDAIGIDLSPNMIAEASLRNPELKFKVGSMTALDVNDNSVDGICAWYSTIHIPDESLPEVLTEFHRVLRPDGYALLAFQVGEQPRVLTEAFGEQVGLIFHRRQPEAVSTQMHEAGLKLHAQLVREPDDDGVESTPQAYLIGRKCTHC